MAYRLGAHSLKSIYSDVSYTYHQISILFSNLTTYYIFCQNVQHSKWISVLSVDLRASLLKFTYLAAILTDHFIVRHY